MGKKDDLKHKLGLRPIFIAFTLGQMVLSVVVAFALSKLVENLIDVRFTLSAFIWMLIFSCVIGSILTFIFNRIVLSPIKELRENMKSVAEGNFDVKIKTDSKIREMRELYEGFNIMAKELSATEILQTDFVSNVSHEIKTPINAIEGYTTLLQDTGLTEVERAVYVDKILFNTKRLSELVGNILLLSKIDNSALLPKKAPFRMDEQIRMSMILLESTWSEKNIEFDVDMDTVEYNGNAGLFSHVWSNLIGNAVKFAPIDGFIKIKLKKQDEKIVFVIEDNGPGIPENSISHIFDKFYQGDSSHKSEGNGLGLSLVKKIIDNAGGEIKAENIKDGGCRFTIVLH